MDKTQSSTSQSADVKELTEEELNGMVGGGGPGEPETAPDVPLPDDIATPIAPFPA
ncbi:MAG: hypothetical protein OXB92_05455 [Acidimicrobiaceae bacterium]|nr:hypothetical protein [Acidimicrobiia bacterium]MCY4493285.1 hypothetical protein [Acidimicrobiaceae bacterium]